jgi:hypothetical protein
MSGAAVTSNFCVVKAKLRVLGNEAPGWRARFGQENAIRGERRSPRIHLFPKGENMKTVRRGDESIGARQIAVLLGVCVGLGIVVHQSFLVVAAAIAVGALAVATAHAVEKQRDGIGLVRHHS